MRFEPATRGVVFGSSVAEATVRVWDLADGSAVPLTGREFQVSAVAISKLDGRPVIASGAADATVCV
jgi:WD40 repeat protein